MITDFTAYHREYYRKRRQAILDYLGGECVQCGTKENLEVDHVNRAEKSFNISRNATLNNPLVKRELDKCQLLCRGHHADKTAQENAEAKCKCDECAAKKVSWSKERNAKRRKSDSPRGPYDLGPVVCGTERSYRNGCRCGDCRKAHSDRAREYRSSKSA